MNAQSDASDAKIRIGISSCLLGQEVRYNGGHKRDRYISEILAQYFEFVPFCPEVAIGLSVPRPPIRLVGAAQAPRAVRTDDPAQDVTDALAEYGRSIASTVNDISGYILKSKSPSCGMERVKVYDHNGVPSASGTGIYARVLMQVQPLLPVEEEGRLNDPNLRDNFIERVFIYHRWQRLNHAGLTPAALVRFHSEHKFLIMAHHQQKFRELGRLVAKAGKAPLAELSAQYAKTLMEALARPAKRRSHANVLLHMAGFFKKALDAGDKAELTQAIDAYRKGEAPLIVPLTLIRHHLRRHPDAYLQSQRYLESRPAALSGLTR